LRDVESEGPEAVEAKLIRPAVEGTVNVLRSVAKHKHSVECVVLTSSVAAVYGFSPDDKPINGKVYTEEDWNITSTRKKGACGYSLLVLIVNIELY
jgi:nucleoside-diphosphate-sugar epimerase